MSGKRVIIWADAQTRGRKEILIRNFQEINYPSCGVGILPSLNIGRVLA